MPKAKWQERRRTPRDHRGERGRARRAGGYPIRGWGVRGHGPVEGEGAPLFAGRPHPFPGRHGEARAGMNTHGAGLLRTAAGHLLAGVAAVHVDPQAARSTLSNGEGPEVRQRCWWPAAPRRRFRPSRHPPARRLPLHHASRRRRDRPRPGAGAPGRRRGRGAHRHPGGGCHGEAEEAGGHRGADAPRDAGHGGSARPRASSSSCSGKRARRAHGHARAAEIVGKAGRVMGRAAGDAARSCPCQVCIMAVGVRPNLEFLEGTSDPAAAGTLVDATQQTSLRTSTLRATRPRPPTCSRGSGSSSPSGPRPEPGTGGRPNMAGEPRRTKAPWP